MDPFYEQRLREEVIYLHSLWRQGPPRSSNNTPAPLQLSTPPTPFPFKKQRKNPRGKRGSKKVNKVAISSGIEWPVNTPADDPPVNSSGWPELKLNPNPTTRLPSPEEQARIQWNQTQQKVLKFTKEFFSGNSDDESDEEDEEMMDEGEDESEKEYNFFFKLFREEKELKGYYEKNFWGGGEFCCLVCGGAGEKFGKRFKDCVAVVQHSVSIAKTKKRRAHRAYGKVICEVLGWDINRLPSVVSTLKSGESQGNGGGGGGEAQGNAADGDNDPNASASNVVLVKIDNGEAMLEMNSCASEMVPDKAPDLANAVDADSMVCEDSLPVADAIVSTEDPEAAEGNAERVVITLCRNLLRRMMLEAVETT